MQSKMNPSLAIPFLPWELRLPSLVFLALRQDKL